MTQTPDRATTPPCANAGHCDGMANLAPPAQPHDIEIDATSDYGSDFGADEVTLLDDLLEKTPPPPPKVVLDEPLVITDIEDYEDPKGIRLPKVLGEVKWSPPQRRFVQLQQPETDRPNQATHNDSTASVDPTRWARKEEKPEPSADPSVPDNRSPLERFRTSPKKGLSVSDLISPAWCELQYFYTLSKHGRKKRTPAMKQGTKVHKKLEDAVHTTVPVDVITREDAWGLRIWNVIQGLRTLRETGETRELEVWGVVAGQVIIGIIDHLGYTSPDPGLEAEADKEYAKALAARNALPEYQTSITDYLLSSSHENGRLMSDLAKDAPTSENDPTLMPPPPLPRRELQRKVYITDVKTRSRYSLPDTTSFRPTHLQLHLYHHLLSDIISGRTPLNTITERYSLDPSTPFSDSFISQVGGLNDSFYDALSSQPSSNSGTTNDMNQPPASSQDSTTLLLEHNNLSSLWDLMLEQLRRTFLPSNSSSATTTTLLSPILTATYLSNTTSELIGSKTCLFDQALLTDWLTGSMRWWKGERPAEGVSLHEAWKCRSCDFKDDCEWIHERDAAAVAEVRERRKKRGEAETVGGEGVVESKSVV